jgi:uncharacterized protein YbaR (Trm112 family)
MFIELTDHLRCPKEHAEQFLVLLPDQIERRQVLRGSLGCPVCGSVFEVTDGVARLGSWEAGSEGTALSAEAALALIGITGPGGYLALVGAAGALAADLNRLLPQVHLVLVNSSAAPADRSMASLLEASRIPLKTGSMRSVVLGRDLATDPAWVKEAVRVVLPGNRLVVEGDPLEGLGAEVLASAPGAWVGRKV